MFVTYSILPETQVEEMVNLFGISDPVRVEMKYPRGKELLVISPRVICSCCECFEVKKNGDAQCLMKKENML